MSSTLKPAVTGTLRITPVEVRVIKITGGWWKPRRVVLEVDEAFNWAEGPRQELLAGDVLKLNLKIDVK